MSSSDPKFTTREHTLVRDVLHSTPDGHAVTVTERVTVRIMWPDSVRTTTQRGDYVVCGGWRVADNPPLNPASGVH